MKVLCVENDWRKLPGCLPPNGKDPILIKVGETYGVLNDYKEMGELYYEVSIEPGMYYNSRLFIPVSDIDETELVQHRELEKVRELCGDRSSR